jgi:dihydrodipicolinate synthase/N-acetylneuraminate lyase
MASDSMNAGISAVVGGVKNGKAVSLTDREKEEAVTMLVEMVKFETVFAVAVKTGAYRACAEYIREQLYPFTIHHIFGNL